ncbi:hypothetical protein [Methanothermococcus okinawensis]|uniref:hypothetical protein n=1 Tax=Methanothermococcus okinawensis TaxID=155863 RepID=UPI001E578CEA|nr:hypothetical protein [Methanothermococcus okinawensis]
MERLEYEANTLRKKVDELQKDVVILADIYLRQQYDIDLDDVINDVLAEEEVSKVILGEDSNG